MAVVDEVETHRILGFLGQVQVVLELLAQLAAKVLPAVSLTEMSPESPTGKLHHRGWIPR